MILEDVPAVVAIERQNCASPWNTLCFYSCLNNSIQAYSIKHKISNEVVGYFIFEIIVDEVNIYNLGITHELHGQGLGTNVMHKIISLSKAAEASKIFLEVNVNNYLAKKLYAKFGFKEISIRKDYYNTPNGYQNASLMCLAL